MKNEKNQVIEGDVTRLIERLEAFEERAGVRLEALFAHFDSYGYLRVNGEMHPRGGTTIEQDISVQIGVYDSAGRLLAVDVTTVSADGFFGFQAFSNTTTLPLPRFSKIRVYPKAT